MSEVQRRLGRRGGSQDNEGKWDRVDGSRGPRTDPQGCPCLGGRSRQSCREPGPCRVVGQEGSGRRGPLQADSSFGDIRSRRAEKRPSDLAVLRSAVTLHHAFADVTLWVRRRPSLSSAPGSASAPGSREVGPPRKPLIPSFLDASSDAGLLSLCCLNLHLSSCRCANVFTGAFPSLCLGPSSADTGGFP